MKNIAALISLFLIFSACNKEDRLKFEFSGIYNVDQIRYETYKNGELISTEEHSDIGVLNLEYREADPNLQYNGEFIPAQNGSHIPVSFQEILNDLKFAWNYSDNRLAFNVDYAFQYIAVTYTITKNRKNQKELFFVYTTQDTLGNFYENYEYMSLSRQ